MTNFWTRPIQMQNICRYNKFKITKVMISILNRVENIVGKGENAGYQHFLLFPQVFNWPLPLGQ